MKDFPRIYIKWTRIKFALHFAPTGGSFHLARTFLSVASFSALISLIN